MPPPYTSPTELLRILPYDISSTAKLAWILMVVHQRRYGAVELGHILRLSKRQAVNILGELDSAEELPLRLPGRETDPDFRTAAQVLAGFRQVAVPPRRRTRPGTAWRGPTAVDQAIHEGWFTPNRNNGLCECGCGDPAPVARRTTRAEGKVGGEPTHFIKGHWIRTEAGQAKIHGANV